MKILIIGNGFDLAHYLPTAYAHFMGVMQAIENLPEGKDEVTFDDLFAELASLDRNKDSFAKTREIYDGDNLKFDVGKIYELKGKLQENKWYRFFKKHMEINTWIDFEERIKSVIDSVDFLRGKFLDAKKDVGTCSNRISEFKKSDSMLFLDSVVLSDLCLFKVLKRDNGLTFFSEEFVRSSGGGLVDWVFFDKIFADLYLDLECLIGIFDSYVFTVVGAFKSKKYFKNEVLADTCFSSEEEGKVFNMVYSFNYTSTLNDFYEFNYIAHPSRCFFLHGQAGNFDKKIVLGVDDLKRDLLDEYKLYGFLKYHQKLFNDTDYLFLQQDQSIQKYIEKLEKNKLKICFWGHSLDVSDRDYIEEIFSFPDGKVVLTVFYFGSAKFDLLANLLKIIGREKIEKWMKKGWLKFKLAPDLYALNSSQKAVEPER